jgi:prevent-host-death family protein
MSQHSVAEARNQLAKLIDRALAGERVVITRHGQPVVELKPVVGLKLVARPPRKLTPADVDWLAARRVGKRNAEGAGAFVSRMRDEEWQR